MANIFISHSTIDKALADYLCIAFEERGLSCWIAPRNIAPGAEWAVSITNAITEADVLFVIYSKNSIKSTQVSKEIGIADRKRKYIIPYKIDDTEPEGAFDYYLTGCHWVMPNVEAGDYKIEELCDIIRLVIKEREEKESTNDIKEDAEIAPSVAQQPVVQQPIPQPVQQPMVQQPIQEPAVQRTIVQQPAAQKPIQEPVVQKKVTEAPVRTVDIPIQMPQASRVTKQSKPSVKTKKNSPAKKERRNLMMGVGIVSALCVLILFIVGCIVLIVGKTHTEDGDSGIFAEQNVSDVKDFEYAVYDDGVYITAYVGEDSEVTIPEEIDGMPVICIDENAFYECSSIVKINMPDSIVEIMNFAFYKCTGLQEITFSKELVKIGEHAFEGCTGLTRIKIPENVHTIGKCAFYGCTGMTTVTLSKGITVIEEYAFAKCTHLSGMYLPEGVTDIGAMAFAYCTGMTELTLPDSMESLDLTSFSGCEELVLVYMGQPYTANYEMETVVSEIELY